MGERTKGEWVLLREGEAHTSEMMPACASRDMDHCPLKGFMPHGVGGVTGEMMLMGSIKRMCLG